MLILLRCNCTESNLETLTKQIAFALQLQIALLAFYHIM
jgi:hypothetical protein